MDSGETVVWPEQIERHRKTACFSPGDNLTLPAWDVYQKMDSRPSHCQNKTGPFTQEHLVPWSQRNKAQARPGEWRRTCQCTLCPWGRDRCPAAAEQEQVVLSRCPGGQQPCLSPIATISQEVRSEPTRSQCKNSWTMWMKWAIF